MTGDERRRSATIVDVGLGALHARAAQDPQADHRRGQRVGARRRARAGDGVRHPDRVASARGSAPSRRAAATTTATAGIVRLVNACGVGVASHMLLTAEPVDAQQALRWQMVTKVVPHETLMEEAETVARPILRNSQKAVRSAKETIAEVIGHDLDAQLRIEAWNGYTCADPRGDARRCSSASTTAPTRAAPLRRRRASRCPTRRPARRPGRGRAGRAS